VLLTDTVGSERYVLTFDNHSLRRAGANLHLPSSTRFWLTIAPPVAAEFSISYSTVAADNAFGNYVFFHEFGHHFAGLADEYYTSSVAYASSAERVEPWEPNATRLLDPANLSGVIW